MEIEVIHNIKNEKIFLNAIRTGNGFTVSCELSGNDPRVMTNIINNNDNFKLKCIEAVNSSTTLHLNALTDSYSERKHGDISKFKNRLKINDKLVLWESRCKYEDVDENTFLSISVELRNIKDSATAMGMSQDDYVRYLQNRPHLHAEIRILKETLSLIED